MIFRHMQLKRIFIRNFWIFESEILLGGIFLPGGKNLSRSDFDDANLFQS